MPRCECRDSRGEGRLGPLRLATKSLRGTNNIWKGIGPTLPYLYMLVDAEPGSGILDKDLAPSNVAAKCLNRLVSSLFHHNKFTDSVHCGLGDASSPEGVTGEELGSGC
jgi:hypothetical protein